MPHCIEPFNKVKLDSNKNPIPPKKIFMNMVDKRPKYQNIPLNCLRYHNYFEGDEESWSISGVFFRKYYDTV